MNAAEVRRDLIAVCTPYVVVLGVMLVVLTFSVASTKAENVVHQVNANLESQP